jgi:hypothetical protein
MLLFDISRNAPKIHRVSFFALVLPFVLALFALLPPSIAYSFDVTLAWDPPPETVAGYKLYFGSESKNYSTMFDVGQDTQHTVINLDDRKKYFFAVTAYNAKRRESDYSEELAYPDDGAVNLLTDGGFESGTLSECRSKDHQCWFVKKDIAVDGQATYNGNFGVKMVTGGKMYQTFSTVKHARYNVSAQIRIDEQLKKPTWGGLVLLINDGNGNLLAQSKFLRKKSDIGDWNKVTFHFKATTKNTKLTYLNYSDGKFEASADDFIVAPVQ